MVPRRKRYPIGEAFNFLLIFFSSFAIFEVGSFMVEGIFFLHLFNANTDQDISVAFHTSKIVYKIGDYEHTITHRDTVDYIYHLLSLGNSKWMHILTTSMFKKSLHSLLKTACRKANFFPEHHESTLRRYVTKPLTLLRHMNTFKKNMAHNFSSNQALFLKRETDGGPENSNMYLKFGMNIPEHCRNTIYMHNLQMHGDYSEENNKFSTAYMLLIEAVLEERHTWYIFDQFTHYCRIEEYNFFLRRCRFRKNIKIYIFLHEHLVRFTSHPAYNYTPDPWVNNPQNMPEHMLDFEKTFLESFIYKKFYLRWQVFGTFSLKVLSKLTIVFNLFSKRILLTRQKLFTEGHMPYHKELCLDNTRRGEYDLWENMYRDLIVSLKLLPRTYTLKVCSKTHRIIFTQMTHTQTLINSLISCWKISGMVHSEYGLSMLKLGVAYRRLNSNLRKIMDKHPNTLE